MRTKTNLVCNKNIDNNQRNEEYFQIIACKVCKTKYYPRVLQIKWVQTTIVNQLNSHERENDKKYYGKMSSLDGSSLTHTELVNIFHQNFRIDPLGH